MPIRSPQAQLKQCMWTAKWLLDIFLHFAAIGFLRRPNGLHVSPWQERMRNKPDPRLHVGKKDNVICHLLPTLNSSIFRLLSSVLSRLLLYIYILLFWKKIELSRNEVFLRSMNFRGIRYRIRLQQSHNKILEKPGGEFLDFSRSL